MPAGARTPAERRPSTGANPSRRIGARSSRRGVRDAPFEGCVLLFSRPARFFQHTPPSPPQFVPRIRPQIGSRAAMRFFEYEAREIVKRAGIPVTDFGFAT